MDWKVILDTPFPFFASVALAAGILFLLGLVIWLIVRMRKLQRELSRIRNELNYANPGPAPKDPNPRPKNEYSANPENKPSEMNRRSYQRRTSNESVTLVPSREPSLSGNEPGTDGHIEMEELYENQVVVNMHVGSNESSTDPVMLPGQQSRVELVFENQGFEGEVINEPVYMNRGELAEIHNPQLELLPVPTR